MANTVDIGNTTTLIVKIPARGATNWSAEFKSFFADKIVDHDHTQGRGSSIKNSALVTNTMVANGDGVTDTTGAFTAYTSSDVAVSTDTIQDAAVTTAKIADDAVNGDKIADNSITAAHIVDGTIIAADVADDAVTAAKINADVAGEGLAQDTDGSIKIDDSGVTTAKINNLAVTTDKIADDAVTFDKLNHVVEVTGDITITSDVENTHFITTSTNSSCTITFQNCDVVGCLFTANDSYTTIELSGTGYFRDNTVLGNNHTLNLNSKNITQDGISNNFLELNAFRGDFEGLSIGVSGTSNSNFAFSYNRIRSYGLSQNIRMPFGFFVGNYIEFITTSPTKQFADFVTDNTSTVIRSSTNAANTIIFNDEMIYNSHDGSTLTAITDTKPFKIIDRITKVSLDPALADLKDVSSTAPTAGQVLKWDGSEWGPGTDASASAGTVVIGSQTDATAYSPSEGDIVVVNAAVTFTQNLAGVTLITDQNITVQNYLIQRVNINSSATVTLDSNSGGGTHPQMIDCIIKANTINIDNTNKIQKCKLECNSFTFLSTYTMAGTTTQTGVEESTIKCAATFSNTTASVRVKIDRSNITARQFTGSYNSIDSLITCYDGTTSSAAADIQINGTSYLNSIYEHPFTVNNSGISTNVVVFSKLSGNQSISTTNATKINFDSPVIDNTSSLSSGTFTAKVGGLYKVDANVYANSVATTSNHELELRSPTSVNIYSNIFGSPFADNSINKQTNMSVIVELEVGEVIEIYTKSTDNSYNITYTSKLSISKING